MSGIAGTAFSAIWGYDIVRYLAARYPSQLEIDWEDYESEAPLVSVLKSFLPLFQDGAYGVYPVPYLAWIRAAKKAQGNGPCVAAAPVCTALDRRKSESESFRFAEALGSLETSVWPT